MDWPGTPAWLGLFSEYLIKTTLVLFLSLLGTAASRRQAAAVRHFLLSFFLIGLLLLPVFSLSRVGWETSLLPARAADIGSGGAATHPHWSEAGLQRERPKAPVPTAERINASYAGGTIAVRVPAVSRTYLLGRFLDVSLPLLWSAGLALLLLKLCLGILGAHRLTREGIDVSDPAWRILMARFLTAIHIKKPVRLKSHARIEVPITWGLLRPVILLPLRHGDWTEDQRSTALLHELGHIKRADFLVLSFVRLSLAVFWFNPLCWIVYRRIKQEQERACDELVLTSGIKPSTYAATLLFFKRTAGCRHDVSAAFLGLFGSASFHERLAAILRQKLTLKEVTMKAKLTMAGAVILAVSLIGLARPSPAGPDMPASSVILVSTGPQSAVVPAPMPATAAGEGNQDKKVEAGKEQAKKAAEQKRTIVITNKNGEKVPIEIITTQGDAAGTIKVDKAMTLKTGAVGKELKTLRSGPVRVMVAGKDLTVVKEGEVLKIEKGDLLPQAASKDKIAARIRFMAGRPVEIVDENGNKRIVLSIQKKTDDQPLTYRLAAEKIAELKAKLAELSEKYLQTKEKQIAKSQVEKAIEKLKPTIKLRADLQSLKVAGGEKPLALTLVKPRVAVAAGSGIYVMKAAGKDVMTVWMSSSPGFSVIFGVGSGEGNRQSYERVLAKVKQELPAGYTVDPEFNEKSGDVTLTISGPESQTVSIELIKKVTEVIKAELKSQE